MSFSPKQQGHYRPLLEEAWQAMCRHEGVEAEERCPRWKTSKRCGECAYCTWYQAELMECSGVTTTTDLDMKRDFENVMYHFAVLAENLYWMTRKDGGDVRRLLHNVHEICAERNFSTPVIVGIAKRALKMEGEWPGWEALDYPKVGRVLSALKSKTRHLRDCHAPAVELLATPGEDEQEIDIPF